MDVIKLISKLPKDIIIEILLYFIKNPNMIIFKTITNRTVYGSEEYNRYSHVEGYSEKYETAFYYTINNNQLELLNEVGKNKFYVKNDTHYRNKFYLSRIKKKNNKYRYYITTRQTITEYDYSHRDFDCGPDKEISINYSSIYVGKNIYYAMLYLM